jgi:Ras-related protein Rab-1A
LIYKHFFIFISFFYSYTVPKKEATEFTKELVNKVENSTLKVAVEKALLFLEKNELPPHWDRDSLFGHSVSSGNSDSDGELDSDVKFFYLFCFFFFLS